MRIVVDRVDTEAALINLDQFKAFDRVDHDFLGAVLSAAGFDPVFRKGIGLLYASPGAMVEVNRTRSDTFRLSRSIRQGCPLSPLLYVLALEPILCGIMLPGANENAGYSAYANDVTMLVSSKEEIVELGKEIERYEEVTGAKINRTKSVGLRLGLWKGVALPGPFSWSDGSCKILGVWFGHDLQLEKNWSEVLEKVEAAIRVWY